MTQYVKNYHPDNNELDKVQEHRPPKFAKFVLVNHHDEYRSFPIFINVDKLMDNFLAFANNKSINKSMHRLWIECRMTAGND